MSLWPGRTYRYYVGKPLFEFGTGLSYTTFSVTCAKKKASPNVDGTFLLVDVRWGVNVTCAVKNVGTREGDEVVMAFHSAGAGIRTAVAGRHPVPIKSLVGFQRTSLVRHSLLLLPPPPLRRLRRRRRLLLFFLLRLLVWLSGCDMLFLNFWCLSTCVLWYVSISQGAGESASLDFSFDQEAIMLVDESGNRTLYRGERTLMFSNGAGAVSNITITV